MSSGPRTEGRGEGGGGQGEAQDWLCAWVCGLMGVTAAPSPRSPGWESGIVLSMSL